MFKVRRVNNLYNTYVLDKVDILIYNRCNRGSHDIT